MFRRRKARSRKPQRAETEADSLAAAVTDLIQLFEKTRQPGPMVALQFLGLVEDGLRSVGVPPPGQMRSFGVLVAVVAGETFDEQADDQRDFEEFRRVAHLLRDARTAIAGSAVGRGPLGDLLFRVLVAWGSVMDKAYEARFERMPEIGVAETVEPPELRLFLRAVLSRFAAALTDEQASAWSEGEIGATMSRLRDGLRAADPELLRAVEADQRLVYRLYPSGWRLTEAELLDMTRDEALSVDLGRAEAV